jgi:hypothetical protein
MEAWEDPNASDSALIIGTLFEIKARVGDISEDVKTIRWILENGDDDEEEEGSSPEP